MTDRVQTALLESINAALRRGHWEEAERILSRLKERAPASIQTRCTELQLMIARRQIDEALRMADRLVVLYPSSARILFFAGQAAFYGRLHSKAVERFEESYRIRPAPSTKQWLGKCLTNLGRFAEAEAILVELVETTAKGRWELMWLYERKGDIGRALEQVEAILAQFPDNSRAIEKRNKLRAKNIDGDEVIEQVELMTDLGEQIPTELVGRYLESLLERGQGARARELVQQATQAAYPNFVLLDMGWICYRHQTYDLAFELFLPQLEYQLYNFKFLNTLQRVAGFVGKKEELVAAYEIHAPKQNKLYGRIKKLKKTS